MKNIMMPLLLILSGCASVDADLKFCKDKDSEAKLATNYAFDGGTPEKFEALQKKCADSDLPVPSKQKFLDKYTDSMKEMCANENKYFRAAYASYKADLTPSDCKDYNEDAKKYELIKADALQASLYKKQIDNTQDKKEKIATLEKLNQITKKYDL